MVLLLLKISWIVLVLGLLIDEKRFDLNELLQNWRQRLNAWLELKKQNCCLECQSCYCSRKTRDHTLNGTSQLLGSLGIYLV